MENKTIICIPGASQKQIEQFIDKLASDIPTCITNADIKIYVIKKGGMFEVVNKLKKVKND